MSAWSFFKKSKLMQTEIVDLSGIEVKLTPEDPPEFERIYTTRISDQVSMKIRTKHAYSSIMYFGELNQTGGRWVLFEPERPADKILDRELLPLIEERCRQIIVADKAFRNAAPEIYIDTSGVKWSRCSTP